MSVDENVFEDVENGDDRVLPFFVKIVARRIEAIILRVFIVVSDNKMMRYVNILCFVIKFGRLAFFGLAFSTFSPLYNKTTLSLSL